MEGMMSGTSNKIHDADPAELENMMKEQVQQNAPEDVAEFIQAIQQDGLTAEEVDEVRQLVLAALRSPDGFKKLTTYLVTNGFLEQEEIPPEYDGGFVLALLGLVGVAADLVAGG